MTPSQPSAASDPTPRREHRSRTTLAAFVLGIPLAAASLCLIHYGPLRDTPVRRYVGHPVEAVEVILFCCAVGALAAKLWGYGRERQACRTEMLPPWDGEAAPVEQASRLLVAVEQRPRRVQGTLIHRRTLAILDFLHRRGSATELDDHLRALADNDALALEGSYALTRIICWAIPILGFLGTVLGITGAISGVTPEVLEKSLSTVTDGLALAFDTTALALGLTMLLMFLSFLVERAEQGVLEAVDRYVDRDLAHRFERPAPQGEDSVAIARRYTDILLRTTEQLVQRQSEVWAQALADVEQRRLEAEQRHQQLLTSALEAALERTLEAHAQRLTALETQTVEYSTTLVGRLEALAAAVHESGREQQTGLAQIAQSLAGQMETLEALARMQEGEQQLVQLQAALNHNLTVLAGSGAFEEAVHSLTAAIHLLMTRASTVASGVGGGRQIPQSGAAA